MYMCNGFPVLTEFAATALAGCAVGSIAAPPVVLHVICSQLSWIKSRVCQRSCSITNGVPECRPSAPHPWTSSKILKESIAVQETSNPAQVADTVDVYRRVHISVNHPWWPRTWSPGWWYFVHIPSASQRPYWLQRRWTPWTEVEQLAMLRTQETVLIMLPTWIIAYHTQAPLKLKGRG